MYNFAKKTDIDVVDNIAYDTFQKNYLRKLKPVIIKQGLTAMPAVGKWNVDYLQSKIGDKSIQLTQHHNAEYDWSMADFFDYIKRTDDSVEKRYLTQANVVKYFPEILDDLKPYPEVALPDWKCNTLLPRNMFYQNYQMELLMGRAGTGFFLHYDRGFMNAFVGQIYGEKEVVLIPPEDRPYLYPKADDEARASVNIWDVDVETYPDVVHAKPGFYTLQPGDLVYIPAHWWHSTRNKTVSIGVTFNSIHRANWKRFSRHIVEKHKKVKNPRYPVFVIRAVLAIVGVLELGRELLLGCKPRKGNQEAIWNKH